MSTTITGTIRNLATATVGSDNNSFVRFILRGTGGNQPHVTGTAAVAPLRGGNGLFYSDLTADSNGAVSGSIYSTRDAAGTGNGEIEVGGSLTAAWFDMVVYANGVPGPAVPIHTKNTATIDISNPPAITLPVVTTAPTGDTTYGRLDGSNSPFTGLVQFNAGILAGKKFNNVRVIDEGNSAGWSGSDIGGWANAAYADLPSKGGMIFVVPKNDGTPHSYSTPIVFNTANKPCVLQGLGAPHGRNDNTGGGACLNYTPTTATSAITLDWWPTSGLGGGHNPGAAIRDLAILNNGGPATAGGSGSSAIGIDIGPTNAGIDAMKLESVVVVGFGKGIRINGHSSGWGTEFYNTILKWNTTGIHLAGAIEGISFHAGIIIENSTGVLVDTGAVSTQFFGTHFDSNTTLGYSDTVGNAAACFFGCHFENFAATPVTTHYINSLGNVFICGGEALDDKATGSTDYWFNAGQLYVKGLAIGSSGRTATGLFTFINRANVSYINSSPTVLSPAPTFATSSIFEEINNTNNPFLHVPTLGLGSSGGVVNLVAAAAATGTITFPSGTGNGVVDNATQTLSSKTLSAPLIGASGTALTQIKVYSQSLTPASVNAATSAEQSFTITGVTTADKIVMNPPAQSTAAIPAYAYVSGADTVKIGFINPTAGALTPSSGTYLFIAIRS